MRRVLWIIIAGAVGLLAIAALVAVLMHAVGLHGAGPDPLSLAPPGSTAAPGSSARAVSPPTPAATPPAAAPVWTVDKLASRLTFHATLGSEPVDGVFKSWDAQIAFDPKNLKASHATFVVEMSSAVTGEPTRDDLLPTPNWFSTHRYPKATLVTRSIVQTGPGRYQAVADLKFHGLARRVTAPFTLSIIHDVGHMQASIMLDRLTYGVGVVPGLPLTSLAPSVQVTLRLVARTDH